MMWLWYAYQKRWCLMVLIFRKNSISEGFVFLDYIQPIALMTEDVDEDSTVTVSGWGAISEGT